MLMIIEVKEKGSKEYCKEVVNTMSQYKKLINRPDAELKDHFKSYPIWTGIMASLFTIWLCHGIFSGFNVWIGVVLVITGLALILLIANQINMNKMVNAYLNDDRTSTVTLDEKGVEVNKGGSQVIRVGWNDVTVVRSFKESICFLAKNVTGFVIAVTNKYSDDIMKYLEDNHVDVKIIQ